MADSQGLISPTQTIRRSQLISEGGLWFFRLNVFLFVILLLLSAGLFIYKQSLLKAQASWQDQVNAQESELKPEGLNQLLQLSNALAKVRDLLASHTYISNAFRLLEAVTHPNVSFSNFQFSADSRKADLTGLAASYAVVAQQIAVLESNPQVEGVSFGGLSLNDNGLVNFKLGVILKPSLLRLRTP